MRIYCIWDSYPKWLEKKWPENHPKFIRLLFSHIKCETKISLSKKMKNRPRRVHSACGWVASTTRLANGKNISLQPVIGADEGEVEEGAAFDSDPNAMIDIPVSTNIKLGPRAVG